MHARRYPRTFSAVVTSNIRVVVSYLPSFTDASVFIDQVTVFVPRKQLTSTLHQHTHTHSDSNKPSLVCTVLQITQNANTAPCSPLLLHWRKQTVRHVLWALLASAPGTCQRSQGGGRQGCPSTLALHPAFGDCYTTATHIIHSIIVNKSTSTRVRDERCRLNIVHGFCGTTVLQVQLPSH